MLLLITSLLLILGCGILLETGRLTSKPTKMITGLGLNIASVAITQFVYGTQTGLIIYLSLLAVATSVWFVFHQFLIDESAIEALN